MTDRPLSAEEKLQALFAASKPPASDCGFEIAVLARLAKQRAIARFTHLAMAVVVVAGLLAALFWALTEGQELALMPILAACGAAALASLVIRTLGQVGRA